MLDNNLTPPDVPEPGNKAQDGPLTSLLAWLFWSFHAGFWIALVLCLIQGYLDFNERGMVVIWIILAPLFGWGTGSVTRWNVALYIFIRSPGIWRGKNSYGVVAFWIGAWGGFLA